MINYIVYSNTDYLDVLKIQTDYISNQGKLILLINNNDLDLSEIYSKYDKIIFYNNSDVYAKRLLTCISQIELDYFILIHDIDILLDVNKIVISDLFNFVKINDVDRIDLKHTENNDGLIKINNDLFLIEQKTPSNYIYNVNPSIWRKETLINILTTFQNKTYRNIEDMDVQEFCVKFKIYKLHTNNKLRCGYFNCVEYFKFLHISHAGKFLILNNNFVTEYGQSYVDVGNEYSTIVNKYNLKNSTKWNK